MSVKNPSYCWDSFLSLTKWNLTKGETKAIFKCRTLIMTKSTIIKATEVNK